MKYALVFLLIFGVLIILAGCSLLFSKDPRRSIFFARMHGISSKKEAQKTAKEVAAALFGVGAAIVLYCISGLIQGS